MEAELRLVFGCLHLSYCCELITLVIGHASSPSLGVLLLLVVVGLLAYPFFALGGLYVITDSLRLTLNLFKLLPVLLN